MLYLSNMGPALISFLFAISTATWVYSKYFGRRAGQGNIKSAAIASSVVGIIAFVILFSLLKLFAP
jgi:hypothetical protein